MSDSSSETAAGTPPASDEGAGREEAGSAGREDSFPLKISPRALSWGVTFFVAATLAGFGALFLITQDLGASLAGFTRFRPAWIIPCLFFATFDWFGGGVRVWLLLRPLGIRLPYWQCVKISGTTAALAYLTPSGAGGGPAHLYGVVREGVSVGRAAASNFSSVLVNLVFLSLAGLGVWAFGVTGSLRRVTIPVANVSASSLFEGSALTFGAIATVVVVFAVNPRPARGWILKLFGDRRWVRTLLRWLHELHESLILYGKRGKLYLGLATLSGALQFGGRFLLGWSVLRGFGFGAEAAFVNVLLLHVLLQFLLYFMPTPGATGIGEVLAPALMSPFLPESMLVAYTAVWRFFLTYLTVAAGGALLLRWIHRDRARLAEKIAPD